MGRDLVVPPLQRHIGSRGPLRRARSEDRSRQWGLLSWGSSRPPLRRRDCRCVHSRMNRRSSFGAEVPPSTLVPSLPFLPAPTVCSAARPFPNRGPKTSIRSRPLGSLQVCCTLQPAMGFAPFQAARDPKIPPHATLVVRGFSRPFPRASTLRSVLLPGSSPPSPRSPAFTGKRCLLVVGSVGRVATGDRVVSSTSRLCSTGRVRSRPAAFPPRFESMLPWALDRHVPACRARRAGEGRASPFAPPGVSAVRHVPRPERPGKANRSRVCLAPRTLLPPHPKVR
jgi:hypothetical protein